MRELTKEQTFKYLSQFISEFGYNDFNDLIQNQRIQLTSYANKMSIPSDAVNLEIKLKNTLYRKLYIKIDFVNKNIELRNYNIYDNGMTVSFNELYNLDRIQKLNEILINNN